jgi:hypothetical protein
VPGATGDAVQWRTLALLGRPHAHRTRLCAVVLFFEIMLVVAVVVITWFALYALYRLITDDS